VQDEKGIFCVVHRCLHAEYLYYYWGNFNCAHEDMKSISDLVNYCTIEFRIICLFACCLKTHRLKYTILQFCLICTGVNMAHHIQGRTQTEGV
jgi:hypothetical protein